MIEPDQIIYLDNNATTRLDPAVVEEMLPFLTSYYGNPSSAYGFGAQVRDAIEVARERVAALIGAAPGEIIFTSGGTESSNSALHSALQLQPARRHLVTTAVEHSATRRHCEQLAAAGCEVTIVGVDHEGAIDLDVFAQALRPDTAIVSAMWANNETGVLFPIAELAELARAKRVPFHTDAVQAVGKIPIRASDLPLNFMSLSAHKIHGPKGVGALYIQRHSAFRPSLFGGGQEGDRRPGTENVAAIIGFGKAADLASSFLAEEAGRVRHLRDDFESQIFARVPEAVVNGDRSNRLPNTSSLSFPGVDSAALLLLLDRYGVCCSAGSACLTGSLEASHVLRAMHLDEATLRSSVRFSFSRFNDGTDVARAAEIVGRVVEQLRVQSRSNPSVVRVA